MVKSARKLKAACRNCVHFCPQSNGERGSCNGPELASWKTGGTYARDFFCSDHEHKDPDLQNRVIFVKPPKKIDKSGLKPGDKIKINGKIWEYMGDLSDNQPIAQVYISPKEKA